MASFTEMKDRARDRLAVMGSGRSFIRILAAVVLLVVLYYVVGALWVHKIDDDTSFVPANPIAGGSRSVDMAAALIEREVQINRWTANDPFFLPGSMLDNMPNFQLGMVYALSRFGNALAEQLARSRGTSAVDPDVDRAAGLLRYPGDVWVFNPGTSLAPTATSESQYKAAFRALRAYNQRVADGAATFERRADNLIDTIERFNNDLGSASAIIDEHLRQNAGFPISFSADDIFYQTKGRLYVYYMLLKALGQDFEQVLAERNLQTVWSQMLESAREAAEQQPWVVLNGGPSSQFVPSHLASQGFLLLRLRTQLREVQQVLLK
ncbi:MAG: DUF2333 family protein [Rhodospirillales bacterium]|nr:DUF2333 family protein [Rhodospirillales bacterium]